jgi:hypothetical protein
MSEPPGFPVLAGTQAAVGGRRLGRFCENLPRVFLACGPQSKIELTNVICTLGRSELYLYDLLRAAGQIYKHAWRPSRKSIENVM